MIIPRRNTRARNKGNDHIPHVFMRSSACASLIWDGSIIGGVKKTHFIKAVFLKGNDHMGARKDWGAADCNDN